PSSRYVRPPQSDYAPPQNRQPTPPARSAGPSPRVNSKTALQSSCGPDEKRFCRGAAGENQGVVECLASHRAELSAVCKNYLRDAHAQPPSDCSLDIPPGPGDSGAPPANE